MAHTRGTCLTHQLARDAERRLTDSPPVVNHQCLLWQSRTQSTNDCCISNIRGTCLYVHNVFQMRLLTRIAVFLLLAASAAPHSGVDSGHQLCCILTAASGYSPERLCGPALPATALLSRLTFFDAHRLGFRLSSAMSSTLQLAGRDRMPAFCLHACRCASFFSLVIPLLVAGWSFSRML